jgi:hypothetical protein
MFNIYLRGGNIPQSKTQVLSLPQKALGKLPVVIQVHVVTETYIFGAEDLVPVPTQAI